MLVMDFISSATIKKVMMQTKTRSSMSLNVITRVLLVLSFGVGSTCMYGAEGGAGGSVSGPAEKMVELLTTMEFARSMMPQQQQPVAQQSVPSGPSRMNALTELNRAADESHALGGAFAFTSIRRFLDVKKGARYDYAADLLLEYEAQLNGQPATHDSLKTWIAEQVAECKTQASTSSSYSSNSSGSGLMAKAMGGGVAGSAGQYFLFNNMRADTSILGAVGAGLTFRTMTVVGDEFEKILRQEGGLLVDAVVGKPVRGLSTGLKKMWNWLFHGGARSYTVEQIAHWKSEVLDVVLKGLAEYASKAQYDQGNGFGAQARVQRYDDFGGTGQAEEVEPEESPGDVTWLKFVDGLAKDLDRLTIRIEVPKRFYSPSDDEDEALMASDGRLDLLDMATRIQEVLQFIKEHVLLPTRTLKDLAAGDLKFLLPRLASEISARFTLFESMVRQYHGLHIKPQSSAHDSAARKEGSPRGGYVGGGYSGYDQQQGGGY
jgi:hypothetical protein